MCVLRVVPFFHHSLFALLPGAEDDETETVTEASATAATHAAAAVDVVAAAPAGVWLVGPLGAALTGLAFKEGLCYGKPEAGALFFCLPAFLLGHLSGLAPAQLDTGLGLACASLLLLFAGRKFAQPLTDDVGDKSVFEFRALPPAAQAALVERLQREAAGVGVEGGWEDG